MLLRPPLVMATLIKWSFDGGEDGSEVAKKRGEQRACAGDKVFDEMLGEVTLVGRGASNAFLDRPAEKSTYECEKHRFDPSKGASSSTM